MEKILKWSGVVALVILAIIFLTSPSTNLAGVTGTTTYNKVGTTEIKVGTSCDDGFTYSGCSGTTIDSTGISSILGTFSGLATFNAGQLRSYTNSSSTVATSETITLAQVNGYDSVILTPNVGALTLTLFASSTASAWLPAAGDMQETCFYNATGTAAATITFVAGVGIDWETVATSTTSGSSAPPAIPALGSGCFKFVRQNSTATAFDISALYTPYINAD